MATTPPAGTPGPSPGPAALRTRWRWAVPMMALSAGLLFGTSAALARTPGFAGAEPAGLPGLIQQRTGEVERLTAQVRGLRADLEQGERDGDGSVLTATLSSRADELAPVVGTDPVEGPALRVTLDDAGYTLDTLPSGYTVDDVVVHQQDVQAVVNALWAGGAEAMMVQDQRIVSTSAIRCVGNTLYLQGRVYSPPYVITAIGDPSELAAAVVEDDIVATYRSWSQVLGLGYLVETLDSVTMPGFAGAVGPEHVVILDGDDTPEQDGADAEAPSEDSTPPPQSPPGPERDSFDQPSLDQRSLDQRSLDQR